MDRNGRVAEEGLSALKKTGLEKCECRFSHSRKDELNVENDQISLLRTTVNAAVVLTGYIEGRKGSIGINRTDSESINAAAAAVLDMARSSEPDPANDISPAGLRGSWDTGPETPDLDLMYRRVRELMEHARGNHPGLILGQAGLDFTDTLFHYRNSNGVQLSSRSGRYGFFPMFTSRDETGTSSFNYTEVSSLDLERGLHEMGSLDTLMKQSTEQVRAGEFLGRFTGDVIITPDCLDFFIDMVCMFLSDYPMIKGTSIFRDSLGETVSSPLLTLRSMPLSPDIAGGYRITTDGFPAENSTIIEGGVLRSFLLSLYGANKTGANRGGNSGGAWVVEAGETPLDSLIKSVPRGVLLCRFSGGMPDESGDFSGVAKNSYLIEDGRLGEPVREMMVSGNLKEMLQNIRGISSERVNSGEWILPWVTAGGVSVSGK